MTAKRWKTPEELQRRVDAYFADDENKPYTIAGLTLACGCQKSTFALYASGEYDNEETQDTCYSEILGFARLKIEDVKLRGAMLGKLHGPTVIFDLKNNHGYKDRSEVTMAPLQVTIMGDDADLL